MGPKWTTVSDSLMELGSDIHLALRLADSDVATREKPTTVYEALAATVENS